jgi:hypothetical protein
VIVTVTVTYLHLYVCNVCVFGNSVCTSPSKLTGHCVHRLHSHAYQITNQPPAAQYAHNKQTRRHTQTFTHTCMTTTQRATICATPNVAFCSHAHRCSRPRTYLVNGILYPSHAHTHSHTPQEHSLCPCASAAPCRRPRADT